MRREAGHRLFRGSEQKFDLHSDLSACEICVTNEVRLDSGQGEADPKCRYSGGSVCSQ